MAKIRVTFEVDTGEMFNMVAKVGDGGAACASRLVEPLLTGEIGWMGAVGLACYGIEFVGSEPAPETKKPAAAGSRAG